MTGYSYGTIVLVPFPFTDLSAAKKRPAVVVSSESYHRLRPDVIILAVTSQTRAGNALEGMITDWRAAGLLKPSVIKPVIATLEQSLVIKALGNLQPADRGALDALVKAMLGS